MFCFTLVMIDNFDYATPTAEFLFERIFLQPQHYETETPQNGMRSDMFYTIKADSFNKTTANDNGTYLNSRSNNKQYFIETNEGKVANIKIVYQTPDVVYVNKENSFTLECYYRQNKSNPFLKRLSVKIKCHTDNLYCPYIGVCYSLNNRNCDEVEILPYRNLKKEDVDPNICTSQKTIDQEKALLVEGHPVQYIYNKLLHESRGPLKSKSQSSEPCDKSQSYSQNAKRKHQGNDKDKDENDLSDLLYQLKSINVLESIVIKKNCYFFFVVTEKQTNDISTICCSGNDVSVLRIDTAYNLCDMWVTDSCYWNERLISNTSGVHPVYLGPTLLHFTKVMQTFTRFALEIQACNPETKGMHYRVWIHSETCT